MNRFAGRLKPGTGGGGVMAVLRVLRSGVKPGGPCFPEPETRVPYPNPHPGPEGGCVPDPPKPTRHGRLGKNTGR